MFVSNRRIAGCNRASDTNLDASCGDKTAERASRLSQNDRRYIEGSARFIFASDSFFIRSSNDLHDRLRREFARAQGVKNSFASKRLDDARDITDEKQLMLPSTTTRDG